MGVRDVRAKGGAGPGMTPGGGAASAPGPAEGPGPIATSGNTGVDGPRGALLDAAEKVVLRDGIGAFSLEAVAREAGLSKGGLLHHYPSKDALIEGMVARCMDEWRADFACALGLQPACPGRGARAVLSMCMSRRAEWTEAQRRRGLVVVAALVHDRRHVERVRRTHAEIHARLREGLAPGVADAVGLASDGLWFGWIFGLRDPSQKELDAVRGALASLVEAGASSGAGGARREAKVSARGGTSAGTRAKTGAGAKTGSRGETRSQTTTDSAARARGRAGGSR